MVPQFKENLFHLEGSGQSLNKNCGADGVVGHADIGLREHKDVIPETSFEVVLHLGKIEVGTESAFDEFLGVMEEVEREVEE